MKSICMNYSDQSEMSAALIDLVESGANLLRAVDCLLRDMQTLSTLSSELNVDGSLLCTLFIEYVMC